MLKLVLIRIPASAAFVRQLVEEGFLIVADICNALCTLCPFIPCKSFVNIESVARIIRSLHVSFLAKGLEIGL